MAKALELSMAAQPEAVRVLRTEVLRWLKSSGIDDGDLAASVGLATSEAVSNVVRHAYGSEGGRVDLAATAGGEDLMIKVSDRGLGLDARAKSRTGLGLPVIGRVSQGVTVASDSDGTTVSMRFLLSRPVMPHTRRRAGFRRSVLTA